MSFLYFTLSCFVRRPASTDQLGAVDDLIDAMDLEVQSADEVCTKQNPQIQSIYIVHFKNTLKNCVLIVRFKWGSLLYIHSVVEVWKPEFET